MIACNKFPQRIKIGNRTIIIVVSVVKDLRRYRDQNWMMHYRRCFDFKMKNKFSCEQNLNFNFIGFLPKRK